MAGLPPADPYDRIAAEYAARWAGQAQAWLTDRLRRWLPPPALVADLGCGTGRDAAALKALGYRVAGLDGSRAMLAQAPAAVRPRLVRADLRRLPLGDGVLDGAVAVGSYHHLPKRELPAALRETRRVVRPGGVVVLSVKAGDGEAWSGGEYDGVARFFAYYQRDELAGLLSAAGFVPRETLADRRWLTVVACAAD